MGVLGTDGGLAGIPGRGGTGQGLDTMLGDWVAEVGDAACCGVLVGCWGATFEARASQASGEVEVPNR